jgi:hypothetical protein
MLPVRLRFVKPGVTARISRAPEVLGTDVGDRHVLLSADLRYLALDDVGRRVWQLLETPRSLSELVAALRGEYDVSEDDCRRDVTAFVERLREHGLVVIE